MNFSFEEVSRPVQDGLPEAFSDFENTIFIQWYPLTLCTYRCSYCYVRHTTDHPDTIQTSEQVHAVLEFIKRTPYKNIGVTLLGGEPTLHPQFFYILKELLSMNSKEKLVYPCVITNGFYKKSLLENLRSFLHQEGLAEKACYILFEFTYHTDLMPDLTEFFENVRTAQKLFMDGRVTVMASTNINRVFRVKEVRNICLSENIKCTPTFIMNPHNVQKPFVYSDRIWKQYSFFSEDEPIHNCIGVMKGVPSPVKFQAKLTDYTVFTNSLNCFQGWECYNNIICIDIDSTVKQVCTLQHHGFISDISYWNRLKQNLKPCVCPNRYCHCAELLTYRKRKIV